MRARSATGLAAHVQSASWTRPQAAQPIGGRVRRRGAAKLPPSRREQAIVTGGRRCGSTAIAAAILSVLVLAGCRSGPSASSALTTTRTPQPTHSEITPVNIGADTSTAPSPVPSSRPQPTAPPATVTVVAAHETFPDGQASLDPPAPGRAPADPTAAWNRIAATLPGNPCGDAKAETVQFGLLTYGDPVPEPAYNKTPEWVLRCVDNPAPLVVPGPAYPPRTSKSDSYRAVDPAPRGLHLGLRRPHRQAAIGLERVRLVR
jgi:hypothetical protein